MKRVFLFLIVLILLISTTSCSNDIPDNYESILLYFSDSDKVSLHSEEAYIESSLTDDPLEFSEAAVEMLLSGPSDTEHVPVIPEGVYVRGMSLSEEKGTVNIDLGGTYYTKERNGTSAELLARYSIVKTLCQNKDIQSVKFYLNGTDMRANFGKGEILSSISGESILINSPSSVETKTEKFVTLYFADKDKKYIVSERRKATMIDNNLENTVVTELLRGPSESGLERIIPEDVSLISIETAEDVCFINLSAGFMNIDDSEKMKLAVYSIVNSVTLLPDIEKVQILIDGKKPENDKEQLFSSPLESNENVIKKSN